MKILKKTGLSSKKLLFIGLLILIVVIVFIGLNALEYNINLWDIDNNHINSNSTVKELFYSNNNKKVNNIDYVYFNDIDMAISSNGNVYINGVNDDITLNTIDISLYKPITKDNIPSISILEYNTYRVVKQINLEYNDGFDNNNALQSDGIYTYSLNINKAIDFKPNTTYLLVLELDTENYYNNPEFIFKVGDSRFRFNNEDINTISNNSVSDNITLEKYNKSSNVKSEFNYNDEHDLEQFNKLNIVINKPNMNAIKNVFSKHILETNASHHTNIMKELDKYTPIKFDVSIKDITPNNTSSNVVPSFKLPSSLTFCESDTNNVNDFMNNGCLLQLFNLLPEHQYQLKVKVIYAQSDNFNNIRESNELNETIKISNNKENDILSTALKSNDKVNFTKDLIKLYNQSNDFNKYQDKQNTKIKNIESNMKQTMSLYKL